MVKSTKVAAPKKAAEKKVAVPKKEKTADKKPTQKTLIVELAEKGKTIDEIVTTTGIKKGNVVWYFSKLKLKK